MPASCFDAGRPTRPRLGERSPPGLSLSDCYWVCEAGSAESFSKVNLFQNPMSQLLANIAFTGYGGSPRNGFSSSPEFTTNGMLPKCWRRISGRIYLYKGGTTGAANAGFEPHSEYYAADIAQAFGANAVDYKTAGREEPFVALQAHVN